MSVPKRYNPITEQWEYVAVGQRGLQGFKGEPGVGIDDTSYNNSTGILTLEFTNNTEFQTDDLRGEKGDKGDDATALETITVSLSDNVTPVAPATAVEYHRLRFNFTVTGVWFDTEFQAPTGSSAIVRVLWNAAGDVNGTFTNIFTSADALTIPAGSRSVGALVPNTTFFVSGGVLRFDIQQVGAVNTGLGYRITLQGTRS
jgi:hypothetical protein